MLKLIETEPTPENLTLLADTFALYSPQRLMRLSQCSQRPDPYHRSRDARIASGLVKKAENTGGNTGIVLNALRAPLCLA
jgi:hypothetical protein